MDSSNPCDGKNGRVATPRQADLLLTQQLMFGTEKNGERIELKKKQNPALRSTEHYSNFSVRHGLLQKAQHGAFPPSPAPADKDVSPRKQPFPIHGHSTVELSLTHTF